ncbi:MAG: hypothetical protein J5I47_07735 [Vicingus serpentipes]|nr:hypothetical protein [Vicingus serpentipes]
MTKKKSRIFIYTDGSCQDSRGSIGGLAYIALNWNRTEVVRRYSKLLDVTTNNQAELQAIIEGIEWFLQNFEDDRYLVVMTDSRYCTEGYNVYLEGWAANDWKVSGNKKRLNYVLWERLMNLKKKSKGRVHIQWIKGHSKDSFNDQAHELSYNVWKNWLEKK